MPRTHINNENKSPCIVKLILEKLVNPFFLLTSKKKNTKARNIKVAKGISKLLKVVCPRNLGKNKVNIRNKLVLFFENNESNIKEIKMKVKATNNVTIK